MKLMTKLTSASMIALSLGFASFNSHADQIDITVPILGEAEYDYVPETYNSENSTSRITAHDISHTIVIVPILGEAEHDYALDNVNDYEPVNTHSDAPNMTSIFTVPILGDSYNDYSS